jgi:hypothetical protein
MNTDFLKIATLKTASIQQVNEALIVLRHFVELNEKLLPMLKTLLAKPVKSTLDLENIQEIKSVFESYNFDEKASEILMKSSILAYIKQAYQSIIQDPSNLHTDVKLMIFEHECQKLKKNWNFNQQN